MSGLARRVPGNDAERPNGEWQWVGRDSLSGLREWLSVAECQAGDVLGSSLPEGGSAGIEGCSGGEYIIHEKY